MAKVFLAEYLRKGWFQMFSPIFLLTLLPTWLVAMVLFMLWHRHQQELEKKQAPVLIESQR